MTLLKRLPAGRPLPLQRRLTLLTTVAVALTMAATLITGWLALRATLWDINERGSLLVARDLAPIARHQMGTTGGLNMLIGPGSTVVEVAKSDGTVLSIPGEDTTLHLGAAEAKAARQQDTTVRNTTSLDKVKYRLVTVPFDKPGYVLVVARPLTAAAEILHVFGIVVLLFGTGGVLGAGFLGRAVAQTALRPVRTFTEAVQHIAETEDLEPISIDRYTGGDLATLTATFNQMLHRLAASRDQQYRLVSDASHELRTPLTSMRTNIDLLALDAGSGLLGFAERTSILGDVQRQMSGFTTVIIDLLDLTRSASASEYKPVDLSAVVRTAVEDVRRRGQDLTVNIDGHPLQIIGDEHSLQRAVTNVLDNAVKWSPPGGTIRIHADGRQLRITDQGPGIAEADLPHIFDRFFRGETARSSPGTGLGLAIAAKAVHDHGGTIEAGNITGGGAQVTIQLPSASIPDAVVVRRSRVSEA